MFFSRLAQVFTKQFGVGWRDEIVVLMDGASYHRSAETRACINHLNMKVLMSAPYSYSASPAEVYFSHFKRGDFNPQNIKTGKR